jgi:hypothetical protein
VTSSASSGASSIRTRAPEQVRAKEIPIEVFELAELLAPTFWDLDDEDKDYWLELALRALNAGYSKRGRDDAPCT